MKNQRFLFLYLLFLPVWAATQTAPNLTCGSNEMMQTRPVLLHQQQQLEELFLAQKVGGGTAKSEALPYVLPVVVHIIHNGGSENIPDMQVFMAIEHLNQAFAHEGYYAQQGDGTNTQIQFCLARRTPDGQLTNGITRTVSTLTELVKETQDQAMKDLVRWDPTQYLNVWVVKAIDSQSSGPGVAGYAYLASAHGQPYDGMVCEAQYFGTNAAEDAVFIHEIGHYLNLYHTFESGCPNDDCTTAGDRVCDTPPDQATHTNCVYNSCGTDADDASANNPFSTDVNDATENFMDYSPFGCYRNFTEGQAGRMRLSIEGFRSSLLESEGCKDPCTLPIAAAFLPSATVVQAGDVVNFTNQTNGATNFEWYVNGNLEATTTDFSYQFLGTGNLVVELRAFNADLNCLGKAQANVQVNCGVTAGFTVNSTELQVGETLVCTNTSAGATGYEWFINGVSVSTGADFSYAFSNAGYYTVLLQANGSYCGDETTLGVKVLQDGPCQGVSGEWTWTLTGGTNPYIFFGDQYEGGGIYLDNYLYPNGVVTKLSPTGDVIWNKKIEVPTNGLGGLHTTADGGCVVSMVSDGIIQNKLCKLSADGTVEWAKRIGFPSSGYDVVLQPVGNKVIAISHSDIPDKLMAVGFDEDGSVEWTKVYLMDPDFYTYATAMSKDSNAIWLAGNFGFPRGAGFIKMDFSGNIILSKRYAVTGNNDPIELRNMDATPDGGFIAAGRVNLPNSNNDFLIMKIDQAGEIEWVKKIGRYTGSELEIAGAVIAKPDGGYLAKYTALNVFSSIAAFRSDGSLDFVEQFKFNGNTTPYIGRFTEKDGMLFAWVQSTVDKISSLDLDSAGHLQTCAETNPMEDIIAEDYPLSEQPSLFTITSETLSVTNSPIVELPIANPISKQPVCTIEIPCPEDCTNALDDDEDGYVDCFDSDCQCFDGADCQPSISSDTPVTARLAWQSPVNLPGINNTPIVANLDPQNGEIPEIIVAEGISDNLNQTTVGKLLIYQGDGSNAANPDVLNIPQLMSERSTAQCVGDVNSDGIPELAVVCWDRRIRVYTNFIPGNSQPMTLLATSDLQTEWFAGHLGMADFDGDGRPEIYSGDHVFQFDFTNPNAPLLKRKLIGGQHSGFNGVSTTSSIAADLLSVSDCNGDPDCEGLELVAGAYIYSVDLDPLDGDGVEIKVARSLNALEPTGNFKDGYNYVADLDLDGILDIVTVGRHGANSNAGLYVWNKNGLLASFTNPDFNPIVDKQFFTVSIANVFDDKTAGFQQDFPEIIFPSNAKLTSFNLQQAMTNPNTPYWWSVNTQDASSAAGPSCFDFNGDGYDEVAYRDERYFRILYGGPLPLPAGVDADRNWVKMVCNSQTLDESPVVADIDADGETEVVTVGYLPPYVFGQPDYRGRLYVFKSDGQPWSPARAVWNQFNYIGVNVNDDLSIPKQQQLHHLEIPSLGSGKRPLNSSRAQWPIFNENFDPNMPVPDVLVTVDSIACAGDSLQVWLTLCNHGSNSLPVNLPIAFYQNDPRQSGAVLKKVSLSQTAVPVDSCVSFSVKMLAVFNAPVFVVANDDGSHSLPYAVANFPVTNVQECYFENNFDGFVFNHQSLSLDLGPDRSLCSNSIVELNAGEGYSSYRWQDGSTDSTFTAFGPGTYWVDVWDGCGNWQSDTVVISLNQTASIELGNDRTICEGENIQLQVPGYTNVQWSPVAGLSCVDCSSPTASPSSDITYYVTAADGNCFVSDSIRVFVEEKPVLTITAQDGDCLNIPQISVAVSGTAPVGLIWSTGATGSSIMPASSGSYSVTATSANGCESIATASVTVTNSIVLTLQTMPLTCTGGMGEASVLASGGLEPYSFNWSNGEDSSSISVATAGPISVTVTDANGCIATATTMVAVAGQLNLGITVSPISCHDGSDGIATVMSSNGLAPFSWLWADGQTTPQITGLSSGGYSVTVTDANGCSDDLSFTITAPTALALTASSTDVNCFGAMNGTATATVSGGTPGYHYFWSNTQATATATQLTPGWHTVSVTDENGCTDTTGVLVSQPPLLIAAAMPADGIVCPNELGAITASATGGTPPVSYLWNNGSGGAQISGVTAGTYTVTATDAHGCTALAMGSILAQPPYSVVLDTIIAASSPSATDGIISIDIVGGNGPFNYLWSNGINTQDLLNVAAGNYSLTITDSEGCLQEMSFTVGFLSAAEQQAAPAWEVSLLPNPTQQGRLSQLILKTYAPQSIDLQLFDITGKALWKEQLEIPAGLFVKDIASPAAAGVYLVVLSNEQEVVCLKWVVIE
ncbi:MAG: T9SS type A sorting domain-containing protein [Bacteroidetes bacterium]|nr:T9SS type A sorting domain-containing protein [Bacteroidota bacterium]